MITCEIHEQGFEPWQRLQSFQADPAFNAGQYGANALFIGTMRDFNEGDEVTAMRLEHYPGMTDKHLDRICREAQQKWSLDHILLLHRVGHILPGEPIVLVSVWSAHRKASFEACRAIMETLKHEAPFWKQETLNTGQQRWVTKNTPT